MTALPALFLGGSSIAGGLIGGAMNAEQASKTRKWQAEQNQIQRDWLTEMSNTAHQRQVDDLRAAGLNPLLSAKYGGASVPSYSGQSAAPADVGSMVAKGMSGAAENVLSMYNAFNTAKLTRAQASLADADAVKALSDASRNNFRNLQDEKDYELEVEKTKRTLDHDKERIEILHDELAHSYDVEKRKLVEAEIKSRETDVKQDEYELKKKQHDLDEARFRNQVSQEKVDNIYKGIGSVTDIFGLFLGGKKGKKRR